MRDRLPKKQPVESIARRLSKDEAKFLFTFPFRLAIIIKLSINAPVAQLDRVLASGAKGRGFKSRLAYQIKIPLPIRQGNLNFWYMPFQTGFDPRGKRSVAAGGRKRQTAFSAAAKAIRGKAARGGSPAGEKSRPTLLSRVCGVSPKKPANFFSFYCFKSIGVV